MVRVDAGTVEALDRWVSTGAVKSRSEAAALFLREGLAVREADLQGISKALSRFEAARDELEQTASRVLGAAPKTAARKRKRRE